MELSGKTINFLGDSITQGHGTTGPEKVFHQLIKAKYNMKHAYNYGLGGTRIARNLVPSEAYPHHDLTFELRAEIMERNAEAVVVFGGTNDFGHGDAPFGTPESEDVYTFYGAVKSLVKKLKLDFPDSKLVFITPLHRLTEAQPSNPDSKILEDYVNVIREVCEKNNVHIIDLFRINPIDPRDVESMPDGLHPSDKGQSIIADIVAEELLKL